MRLWKDAAMTDLEGLVRLALEILDDWHGDEQVILDEFCCSDIEGEGKKLDALYAERRAAILKAAPYGFTDDPEASPTGSHA